MKKIIGVVFLLFTGAAFCAAQSQFTGTDSFREEGIASWYGAEFEGKPTASGEPFDPKQFTAAHQTLPFGTIVLITNLENNNQITVRINDRGPFVHSRIIDVSEAAAEKLGIKETGIARVLVEIAPANYIPARADIQPLKTAPETEALHLTDAGQKPPPQTTETDGEGFAAAQGAALNQMYYPVQKPNVPPVSSAAPRTQPPASSQPAAANAGIPTGAARTAAPRPAVQPNTPAAARQPSAPYPAMPETAVAAAPAYSPLAGQTPAQPGLPQRPAPSPTSATQIQPIPPSAAAAQANAAGQTRPQAGGYQSPVPPVQTSVPAVSPVQTPAAAPQTNAGQQRQLPPAKILGGPITPGRTYKLQIGSYQVRQNAVNAYDKLLAAGLNPQYEPFEGYYRIVLSNIRAEDIPFVSAKLGNAGFKEAVARLEGVELYPNY